MCGVRLPGYLDLKTIYNQFFIKKCHRNTFQNEEFVFLLRCKKSEAISNPNLSLVLIYWANIKRKTYFSNRPLFSTNYPKSFSTYYFYVSTDIIFFQTYI